MATINWTDAWRLTYETVNTVRGSDYFVKEGLWILCGNPDIILTATDADLRKTPAFWTPRADGGGSAHNAVASDASRAVIVSGSNWVNESTDGVTWSAAQTSPAAGENLSAVASGQGFGASLYDTFVAVSDTLTGKIFAWFSAGSWSLVDTGGAGDKLYGVCSAPDLVTLTNWVAVGTDGSDVLIATSGNPQSTWARYTTTQANVGYSCARGNGLFMVGCDAGKILTSTSGSSGTWTLRSTGGTDNVYAVNYLGGSSWLAVGGSGAIYTSDNDGVSWDGVSAVASGVVRSAASYINEKTTVMAADTRAWSSFEETQEDHDPIAPPAPGIVLPENITYTQQAIRRLAQQFRG